MSEHETKLIDELRSPVSMSQFLSHAEMFAYLHHLKDQAADEIDRLNAQLAEAKDRGLEDAAVWHDYQVSDLEAQIKRNDEYRTRTGNSSAASEANDFCRSLQSSHRISAAAIRALKGKTDD